MLPAAAAAGAVAAVRSAAEVLRDGAADVDGCEARGGRAALLLLGTSWKDLMRGNEQPMSSLAISNLQAFKERNDG